MITFLAIQKHDFWAILGPICPNSQKREIFLKIQLCHFGNLSSPNFMQKIRKNNEPILQILRYRRTDGRTDLNS